MNDIIQVSSRTIGNESVQTVSARELHAFLEVGKDFTTWIKDRVAQYGFIEGQDFVSSTELRSPKSGSSMARQQTVTEFHITTDMAKELSMVERNERGKQARAYFIECERRAKTATADFAAVLADPAKLRDALLSYTEKVVALEAKVQEQAPKARFHDAVTDAINCQSVQEVAKILGTGPNRLFKFLRDEGMLMRDNLPYQQHIDAGHFRVVERQYADARGESHTYSRTLVTGKGLAYIQRKLQSLSRGSLAATV